jgi:argininosuccinate lyase
MGFAKVQENPMYSGLSRGLFEHDILTALGNFLMIISRFNNDILLFTTSEFGFLSLPDTMTTGSSIMPQKRNYDVCELIRAKISLFFGYSDQMRNLYTHLMSGYQRDLQMTKSILINGYTTWKEIIDIMILVGDSITFHEAKLEASMTPELYATDEVYKLVMQGESFRDAYQKIKNSIHNGNNN